jgi:hypothetical protein
MIHINVLEKQLMWATLILIMRISMGSRKLAWPIVVLGLFSVVSIMDIEGISPIEGNVVSGIRRVSTGHQGGDPLYKDMKKHWDPVRVSES